MYYTSITFLLINIYITTSASIPPINAVISCGIPIIIMSLLATFDGIANLNNATSFLAESDKNANFNIEPISMPKYLP